ncbi:MAG: hypothetical protein ABI741_07355 [Ferruginibacter sp.]
MRHMGNKLSMGFVLVVLLASCDTTRYAYSPNAHNVPLLAKQWDSKVSANYSTNAANIDDQSNSTTANTYSRNRSNGYDLQAALAVTNNIAIQGNYYSRSEKTNGSAYNGDSSVVRYKRNLAEFGAGYFTSINKKGKIFFQVFGGVGFGKLKLTEAARDFNGVQYTRFYNSDILKYYLEPAIIFRSSKEVFAASISTRFSVINFKRVNTNYTLDEKQTYNLDSLNRYAIYFLEPAFVNSFGFNKLPGFRIEYQLGLSIPLDVTSDFILDYRPFNFSIGLSFDIGKLIKGSANKNDD